MTLRPLPPPGFGAAVEGVPFVRELAAHGDRLAVVAGEVRLTYAALAQRVADTAARLGGARKLVLVAGSNELGHLVGYLSALWGGHVAMLVPPGATESLAEIYDPDAVVSAAPGADAVSIELRREISAHQLHPELALVMSTSGSTGSPKLVRLSHDNVQSNADAIAAFLGIRDSDAAATTLPMHYVYGLSIVHTHLLRGASLVLTDLSVADACFWDLFRAEGCTGLAGVPHTFDLLDRVGFVTRPLPRLRYVTQAGGRLAPEKVRRYAELGQRQGWDFFVMYGQTEATARMAYLPSYLARTHPHAIGVPIPGGSFTLGPLPDGLAADLAEAVGDAGELVYAGPNVMLGYAHSPADLASGRSVQSLHTGDIARRTDDGLYEIVGRLGRFVKIAGHRVDLHHLENALAGQGWRTSCAGRDDALVVAVEGAVAREAVRDWIAGKHRLPPRAIRVCVVDELPRLSNGKPDYRAIVALGEATTTSPTGPPADTPADTPAGATPEHLRELFAEILNRPDATVDDTFVSLGGDSLSYVEASIRLEDALGHVPAGWHLTPIRELSPAPRPRRFGLRRVEASVALRAVAIACVVGTHAGLFTVLGGAHVLLAVAGYVFARFRLAETDRRRRFRAQLAGVARVAVPSMVWIGVVVAVTDQYGPLTMVLLNSVFGAPTWTSDWQFWFIELYVYILIGLAFFMRIPWVDRIQRRFPLGFAMAMLGFGLLTRFGIVDLGVPHTMPVFWLFAAGWAAARVSTWWQRLALTAILVATVPGFFGDQPMRELAILVGIAVLIWARTLVCPAPLQRAVSVLAGASLYIYLTHWQVFPQLTAIHPAVATVASIGVGIAVWALVTRVTAALTNVVREYANRRPGRERSLRRR